MEGCASINYQEGGVPTVFFFHQNKPKMIGLPSMFLQHWSLHNIEAYLRFLTSPPLQVIYMLNRDQTIWVKTEVLLGTPKGRQWGTY
jgi:hypothetical protein